MSEVTSARTGFWFGPESMAAAMAIAAGTSAYAEPVRFENDGSFDWRPSECGGQNYLDITAEAGAQSNQPGDSSFSQIYYYGLCNDDEKAGNYMYAGLFFGAAAWVQGNGYGGTVDRLEAGYQIGENAAFGDNTTMSIYSSPCCYENDWGTPGTTGYIGVWFKMNGQKHYGWIKATLTDPRGAQLEALAWGYESSANTFIEAGAGGNRCYPDFDANGVLDLFDFLGFVNAFNAANPSADCDENGSLDLFDFLCFTNAFNAGC